MLILIGFGILLSFVYILYQYFFPSPNIDPHDKYVLISGCDTGVGHLLALELDQQGFNIFAGVYLSNNISLLKNKLSLKATVFHLDITKQEDINAAYDLVKQKTNVLHALVNNAGIIIHGCIDWTSLESMHKLMDVNFFGHVVMTKKFLPLLITKRNCRVVNMGSASAFFRFPNTSAYSATKYALESFSDCLRREMAPWGLKVSIIEPGTLQTLMTDNYEKNLRSLWNELSNDIQERWGIDFLNNVINQSINSPFIKHADHPFKAVQAIQHAIMNTNPCIHYRPGWQAKLIFILYWFPVWLIDRILAKALYFIPADLRNSSSN